MPVYEYECSTNKHRFERTQRFSDPPVQECPECGSGVRRVIFPAGIVFKGSGWYVTDSRKSSSESSSTSTAAAGSAATKGDTKPDGAAAKPESAGAKSDSATPSKSDSAGTAARAAKS